ncbi:MAG: hypothetical protein EOO04_20915 [Chitinophagaceae bacterium]|nr:MAG: hypothetical protein EOO04_20915 [Chitinophagaceae bacterium]
MNDCTVFIHVYYTGSWKMITGKCSQLLDAATNIIVSACDDDVIKEISDDRYAVVIQKVTNKGKDIGGKLAGLSYYYQFCEPTTYLAFMHDKISPQTLNAGYWFDQLYEIFTPGKLDIAARKLADPKIGVAGSSAFLKNEYSKSRKNFDTTNSDILLRLLSQYQLQPGAFDYIGGTIFLARDAAFRNFFRINHPLLIREDLEEGNVLDLENGTNTHSWERMLCFIPQAAGFKIAGV